MKAQVALSIVVISLFFGCSKNSNEKGIEIFPDMIHSVAYEAYSANSVMSDGKTMMLPPKHSIARGRMPITFGPGAEEAKRAGEELLNPLAQTEKTLERGSEVYTNYCLVCHGAKGEGDGPIIPKFPNPPSLTSRRIREYPIGRIFHIISLGSGDMPSHQEQIDYNDRWYLAQYVKYMQKEFSK